MFLLVDKFDNIKLRINMIPMIRSKIHISIQISHENTGSSFLLRILGTCRISKIHGNYVWP